MDAGTVTGLLCIKGSAIRVSLRWWCWTSGSCRNKVTALVARGYCGGAGPMSCLLLSGQGTIILIAIDN